MKIKLLSLVAFALILSCSTDDTTINNTQEKATVASITNRDASNHQTYFVGEEWKLYQMGVMPSILESNSHITFYYNFGVTEEQKVALRARFHNPSNPTRNLLYVITTPFNKEIFIFEAYSGHPQSTLRGDLEAEEEIDFSDCSGC